MSVVTTLNSRSRDDAANDDDDGCCDEEGSARMSKATEKSLRVRLGLERLRDRALRMAEIRYWSRYDDDDIRAPCGTEVMLWVRVRALQAN